MIDMATRFAALRLPTWQGVTAVIEGVLRGWEMPYIKLQSILCDPGSAFCSNDFGDWCRNRGVKPLLEPVEAHHRLGVVERRHQVNWEMIGTYLQDNGDYSCEGVKEVVTECSTQAN